MNGQTKCVNTYNEILFSLNKGGNSDTSYDVDGSWGRHAKENKPVMKGQILHGSTYLAYLDATDWMFVSPYPKFICWNLILSDMVFGGGVFGK